MDFLTTAGLRIPVEFRRRKGTRHLRLSLGLRNQVVASAPWHTSERSVAKFIEKQRGWIEEQLVKAPDIFSLSEWLKAHPRISSSGRIYALRVEVVSDCRSRYCFDKEFSVLHFRIPNTSEELLRKTFRKCAVDVLTDRVAYHAKRLNLKYSNLTVRDQSTRWGSCSARGTISLNWRLLLLLPYIQDYVILHELAHLSEMNHGKRFWALLKSYDPNLELHEAELDTVSSELMRVAR